MNEFIDKLIERLEELKTFKLGMADAMSELMKKDRLDNYISREEVISIVNELAEEYNKKTQHEIFLEGCDDYTCFKMDLTESEYKFLLSVSELANKTSTYGCMPRMYVGAEGE